MIEKIWESNGYMCVVNTHESAGHRCGYVGVEPTHKLYGKDYNKLDDIDVHGGLTFSDGGKGSSYPITSDLWWFGYDCAHYRDKVDTSLITNERHRASMEETERMFPVPGCEIRTLQYCITECENLARQLKAKE